MIRTARPWCGFVFIPIVHYADAASANRYETLEFFRKTRKWKNSPPQPRNQVLRPRFCEINHGYQNCFGRPAVVCGKRA